MTELRYTKEHEAVLIDGDVAYVGITKYALEALGDLVYIELPDVGRQVEKGGEIAVIESVKTAAEIYAPVSGEVIEANAALEANLDALKKPLDKDGWIAKIRLSSSEDVALLMDEAEYATYLRECD
ncbi:MAG: glycine cleavage system protein GcvH [Rickettsiales bacterium]